MSIFHTITRIHFRVLLITAILLGIQGCAPMTKHIHEEYIQTKNYKQSSSLETIGKKSTGVILLPLVVTGDILFQPVYIGFILLLGDGKLGC